MVASPLPLVVPRVDSQSWVHQTAPIASSTDAVRRARSIAASRKKSDSVRRSQPRALY